MKNFNAGSEKLANLMQGADKAFNEEGSFEINKRDLEQYLNGNPEKGIESLANRISEIREDIISICPELETSI